MNKAVVEVAEFSFLLRNFNVTEFCSTPDKISFLGDYLSTLAGSIMTIKNLFNKKKGRQQDSTTTETSNEIGSIQSAKASSSSSSSLTNSPYVGDKQQQQQQQQKQETLPDAQQDSQTISKSFQYSYNSNTSSLFSSKRTLSTNVSSHPSSNFSYNKDSNNEQQPKTQTQITGVGRPLRVLHEEEETEGTNYSFRGVDVQSILDDENSNIDPFPKSRKRDDISLCPTEKSTNMNDVLMKLNPETDLNNQLNEFIKTQLRILANSINNSMIQISQSVLNLTKASIKISDSMESVYRTIKNLKYLHLLKADQFNTSNSVELRKLIKNILHLLDNLLIDNVYNKSKALIIKNLYDLFVLIKVIPNDKIALTNFITEFSPTIFPISNNSNDEENSNIEKVNYLMNNLLLKDNENMFRDQEGAFVAPILRGFNSSSLSVITFVFGFPQISREHQDIIKFFSTQLSDIHFLVQKNHICIASASSSTSRTTTTSSANTSNKSLKLKMPFRTIEINQDYIPISMSISTNNSKISSGTLGGYLYPRIGNNCNNPKLLKYKGEIFGLTCGHVVLGNEDGANKGHPNVSIPSPVLINLYKNALVNELKNHSTKTPEFKVYSNAIKMLDMEYPLKKTVMNGVESVRNLPRESLGNVIWGERLINDNKLSDLAIIKINSSIKNKKFLNYLGEDLQLSQFDTSLILSNLNIKRTVSLQPRKNGILNNANLNVFKIGSTTGYTRGKLNGMKMIYWSDGSLRSSEFIISNNSDGKAESFANGGDSGAFVLGKLCDVNSIIRSYASDDEEGGFEEEERGENERQQYEYEDEGEGEGEGEDDEEEEEEEEEEGDDEEKEEELTFQRNTLTSFIESFIPKVRNNRRDATKVSKRKTKKEKQRINEENGLGVLGMLHSYDGELKQFGLFTPIDDILDRLEIVTGIKWGVVGCSENEDLELMSNTSLSSGSVGDNSSDKEFSEEDIE